MFYCFVLLLVRERTKLKTYKLDYMWRRYVRWSYMPCVLCPSLQDGTWQLLKYVQSLVKSRIMNTFIYFCCFCITINLTLSYLSYSFVWILFKLQTTQNGTAGMKTCTRTLLITWNRQQSKLETLLCHGYLHVLL